MRDPETRNKKAGINSRFANCVPTTSKWTTKFGLKDFKGKRRLQSLKKVF